MRDLLKRSRDLALELLGNMDSHRLESLLVGPGGMEMTGHEWVMLALQHEAEHRGNLVVHVKCNGGHPPDIIAMVRERVAPAASVPE